jgi:hypothetical protein
MRPSDPAVYPHFNLYYCGNGSTPDYWREEQPVVLPPRYPALRMCESVALHCPAIPNLLGQIDHPILILISITPAS